MDKLFKALQIAQTGLGVAVNYDKFMNEPERLERHRRELEAQKKREVDLAAEQQAFEQSQAGMEFLQKQEEFKEQRRAAGVSEKLSRDRLEFDKRKLSAETAADEKKKQQAQAQIDAAKPTMRGILTKIPEKQQKEAIKEFQNLSSLAKLKTDITADYQTIADIWQIGAAIPRSDWEAEVETAKTAISGAIVAAWPERMSDQDFEKVKGFVPDVADSADQVAIKRDGLIKFLEGRLGATPIMDQFGVPKPSEASSTTPDENEGPGFFDRAKQGASNALDAAGEFAGKAADFVTGGRGGSGATPEQVAAVEKHTGGNKELALETLNILMDPAFQQRKKKGRK